MASFRLEFEQGGQTQQVNFAAQSVSIGRDRSSDFVLDHPTVSRQHALIVDQGGGRFQLVVLSRGGLTAVNGQPVQTSEVEIYDQTQLTFGQYTVRFRCEEALQAPVGGGQFNAGVGEPFGGGQQQGGGPFGGGQFGGGQQQGGGPFGGGQLGGGQVSSFGGGAGDRQFGSGPVGGVPPAGEPPKEEKTPDGGAGIMSWDEIAASSEADEEEEFEQTVTDFQRLQSANQEKSNPVVIVGGLGLAVSALVFAVLISGGGESRTMGGYQDAFEDWPLVEIEERCFDEATCRREAERHYELGLDRIERHAVETENLFRGYVHLLTAQELLYQGGIETIPQEMGDWQSKHDRARQSLDQTFRDQRMRFHQAAQRSRHGEMANVLNEIQVHFPDRTARENRWARDRERLMRNEGIYPRRR